MPTPLAPSAPSRDRHAVEPQLDARASAPVDARAAWRWVRWLVAVTLLLLVAIAAFNAAIDPTGKLGTGLLDPTSRLARDRAAKVELLESGAPPELVVLGSSRAKQLDPRDLAPDAERSVNAAFVGGDLFEERVMTAWLSERAREQDRPFPHLVVAVDVEGFRGRSLRGSGLLAVDQVRSIARREAGSPSPLELLPDASDLLLTMDTTRTSWRTMRLQLRQREHVRARLNREDRTVGVEDFDAVGMPKETRAWLQPDRLPRLEQRTRSAIDPSIERYRANYREQGAALSPDSIEDLRRVLALAEQHDDTPLVFITPAHPRFAAALDPEGRRARHAELVALLDRLSAGGRARVVDCSSCVPGEDRYWLDGAHTSPLGARVLAEELRRRTA